MTSELVQYEDEILSFKHPKGLHKKSGAYVFERPKPRNRPKLFEWVSIEIDPSDEIADWMRINVHTRRVTKHPDLHQEVVACGSSDLLPGAIEYAITSKHSRQDFVEYRWDVMFPLQGHMVWVALASTGDFNESRARWAEVIRSIRLIGEPAPSAKARGRNERR